MMSELRGSWRLLLESLSSRRFCGHERRPEVVGATIYKPRISGRPRGQVADARTALLRSKIERHDWTFILHLGEKYFVTFPIVDKLLTQKHEVLFRFS